MRLIYLILFCKKEELHISNKRFSVFSTWKLKIFNFSAQCHLDFFCNFMTFQALLINSDNHTFMAKHLNLVLSISGMNKTKIVFNDFFFVVVVNLTFFWLAEYCKTWPRNICHFRCSDIIIMGSSLPGTWCFCIWLHSCVSIWPRNPMNVVLFR